MNRRVYIYLILVLFGLYSCLGCEAFVRKFTRKKKKRRVIEEVVFVPEEYPENPLTQEELYRQYFIFWKSWQEELISYLRVNSNHKKQLSCVEEAIKNLNVLKQLLVQEKAEELEKIIAEMNSLKDSIARDIYGTKTVQNRNRVESLYKKIFRYFSFAKVKGSLK